MTDSPLAGLEADVVRQTFLDAVDIAAAHTLPRFRTGIAVDNKLQGGFDPVTEADREAERAIRALLAERFPDHGVIGEELDDKPATGRFSWIIDPIDGTRAFIAGVPVWGTLLGLLVDGRAVAGLMAQPFIGEVFLSLPGEARYYRGKNGIDLRVSTVTELAKAKLTTTSPDLFLRHMQNHEGEWSAVRDRAMTVRYGLDCYGYCLLAAGHIDLVVEAGLKNVDIAPLIPIIRNAGGVVTDWEGGAAENGGRIVAAATPELHAETLRVLRDRA
jgi:histidinol phosphatase-like enzyme (inositol monophosphatase family)